MTPSPAHRVLLLADAAELAGWGGLVDGIAAEAGRRDTQLHIESSADDDGAIADSRFAFLQARYGRPGRLAGVIIVGSRAAAALANHRPPWIEGVPLLLLATGDAPFPPADGAILRGRFDPDPVDRTPTLMRALAPDAQQVLLACGEVSVPRCKSAHESLIAAFDAERVVKLPDNRLDAAEAYARAAPSGTLIYALKLRRDGVGIPVPPAVAASRLAATGLAVFGNDAAEFGHGIVGGDLLDGRALGAAAMAQLLAPEVGADNSTSSPAAATARRLAVDARRLDALRLPLSGLPPETALHFTPQSLFEVRPREAALAAVTVMLLAAAAALLLLLVLQSRRQQRRLQAEVEARSTELAALAAAAEAKAVATEAASRAKTEALAAMSHELRTPLNTILGFSEVMRMRLFGSTGSSRYDGYLDDIHRCGEELLALVNDVLDLAKIESGRMPMQPEPLAVAALIAEATHVAAGVARQRDIVIGGGDESGGRLLLADRRMAVEMVRNLLSNALASTSAGGRIDLTARCDGEGRLLLLVADTGHGMTAATLAALAPIAPPSDDPFAIALLRPRPLSATVWTAGEGGNQAPHGLGLGLVRAMMALHGGSLTLASNIGQGTTVTLIFPPSRVLLP